MYKKYNNQYITYNLHYVVVLSDNRSILPTLFNNLKELCASYSNVAECLQRNRQDVEKQIAMVGSASDLDKRTLLMNNEDDNETNEHINIDMSPLLELCPGGAHQMSCMKHYLSQLFKEVVGETSHHNVKRSLSVLCPPRVNRMACFDQYMSFWISMVRRETNNDKRMYFGPGKRSYISPIKQTVAADQYTPFTRSQRANNKKSLCSTASDNLSCFEQYLSLYAKIKTATGTQQQNRFVGKRTPMSRFLKFQVCKQVNNERREECYRNLQQRIVSYKNSREIH